MAEFDCFVVENEFSEILEMAFDDGYRLLLNKNSVRLQREYVSKRDQIHEVVTQGQYAVILERDDFSRFAVRLRPIEREGIKQSYP